MGAVERSGWSEEQTGVQMTCDLKSEDALPTALVRESRARGRSDPQAEQEPVRMTPPLSEVRGVGRCLGAVLVLRAHRHRALLSESCCSPAGMFFFLLFFDIPLVELFWRVTYPHFLLAAGGCRG